MTAQEQSHTPTFSRAFEMFRSPLRGWQSQYFESWGFDMAKEQIAKLNRQYAVTEIIHILLDTAGYRIPESDDHTPYESPLSSRQEDGKLLYVARSLVYRTAPESGRKQKPFDGMDWQLFNTFNINVSPHNALHLLDVANEADIAFMKGRLRNHRLAIFHGNPPILTRNDASALRGDLGERLMTRFNIRSEVAALRGETNK